MAKEQDQERKRQGKQGVKTGDEPEWKNSQRAADVALPAAKYAAEADENKK